MRPKSLKPLLVAFAAVLMIGALAVGLLSADPHAAPPPTVTPIEGPVIDINFAHVDWTPETLIVAISPGETRTIAVKVKSSGKLPSTIPQISPNLQPYLTISPATIPYFSGPIEQTLHMTFSIPSGAPFQDIDGTVSLRTTKLAIAKSLPIKLHIWPATVPTDSGLTLSYPPDWQNLGGMTFSNVPEFTPPTDSLISDEAYFSANVMVNVNPSHLPIEEWFAENFESDADVSGPLSSIVVNSLPGLRFRTVESIYPYIHILISRDSDVIWITFRANTPAFEDEYEAIVSSIRF